MAEDNSQIGQLFQACDLDGSGYIDERELASICSDLSADEVSDIFHELDKDGNGRITIAEFSDGFKDSLLGSSERRKSLVQVQAKWEANNNERLEKKNRALRRMKRAEVDDVVMAQNEVVDEETELDDSVTEFNPATLDEGFTNLTCQEQVCDFYQQLHSSEEPHLVQRFEDILLSVIKDIRQQQYENDRLEKSFKREKDQHSRHLMQLEEELEVQMQKVETKVRHEEKLKLESEKEDLKSQLETEITQLQSNLVKLQEMKSNSEHPTDEMKSRLGEMLSENRHLRSTLTDAQTNLALVKSEMAEVRHDYHSKCGELETEKDCLGEFVREQDSLTRQIGLMHDANKKLHDTNDDLQYALDVNVRSTPIQKRAHSTMPYNSGHYNRPRIIYVTGSRPSSATSVKQVHGDYVSEYLSTPDGRPRSANSSLAEELGLMGDDRSPHAVRRLLPAQDQCEVDSLPDDFDSGHSTLRDGHDIEYCEFDPGLGEDSPFSPRKRNRLLHGPVSIDLESMAESELQGFDDLDGDMSEGFDGDVEAARPPSRAASNCSKSSSRASGRSQGRRTGRRRRASPSPQKLITAEPERMYKVVLCGDAAVGKSSFILRLCKDRFVSNLNSTLGVDFHTKTLEIDGRIIALQLWDTAGQERFRSIAKSYFRRADGVLLLYDVTYERSFINVRDWVEAVEDGAENNVPIMLAGNKTDLRDEYETERARKCVKTEDGQRLAREFNALFIETSAKEGDNILEAVTELSRLLRTNEDLEIKNVGMKLSADSKKSSCCSV